MPLFLTIFVCSQELFPNPIKEAVERPEESNPSVADFPVENGTKKPQEPEDLAFSSRLSSAGASFIRQLLLAPNLNLKTLLTIVLINLFAKFNHIHIIYIKNICWILEFNK